MIASIRQSYVEWLRRLGLFIVISLPIVIFLLPFILNYRHTLDYDWDYFTQLYEAARKSILEYKQFPWMNPWIAGGVPLYANPQFGLISIQLPLVLIFGTLLGLRLSVLVFFILGFWGMRSLLLRLGSEKLVAILLSYIWVFSGFTAWHLHIGHFTFLTYFLAPWFFLCLLNIRKKYGWLWLGLIVALILNQSVHYIAVQLILLSTPLVIYQIFSHRKKFNLSPWRLLKPYVFAFVVALPLAAHKLYFSLQYIHDYPRVTPPEIATPFNLIIAGLTFRGTNTIDPTATYGTGLFWAEYSVYFGLLTLAMFSYLLINRFGAKEKINSKEKILLLGILLLFLLALGSFSRFSPYSILKELPIFNQMQVPARWLGWLVVGVVIFLGRLKRRKVFIFILLLSVVDVFLSSFYVLNYKTPVYKPPVEYAHTIQQQTFYKNGDDFSPNSYRLLHATQANIGDIYGYEPLVGFAGTNNEGYRSASNRCDANGVSCDFVITKNAVVDYWSPNLIKLRRVGPDDIRVNVNPGSYWIVNSQRIFKNMDVVELKNDFVITDPSQEITLTVSPRLRVF